MRSSHDLTEKQVSHRPNGGKVTCIVKTADRGVYLVWHRLMSNIPSILRLVKEKVLSRRIAVQG